MSGPRVALLGFSIECNRFAPITHENDFTARTLLGGEAMLENARSPAPMMLGEMPGFVADMDSAGPWRPVPGFLAMAEPNGPVSQEFFDRMMAQWEADLRAAGALDGVYCVLHGAGLTVNDHDPEGTLLAMIRRVAGESVPVVATYDLHANVSAANVDLVNAYIGYRTNPHLDMRERGAEAAQVLRLLMTGTRTFLARARLPIPTSPPWWRNAGAGLRWRKTTPIAPLHTDKTPFASPVNSAMWIRSTSPANCSRKRARRKRNKKGAPEGAPIDCRLPCA